MDDDNDKDNPMGTFLRSWILYAAALIAIVSGIVMSATLSLWCLGISATGVFFSWVLCQRKKLVSERGFHSDPPEKDGWHIEGQRPAFKLVTGGQFGSALQIKTGSADPDESKRQYYMDYKASPKESDAKWLEFILKPGLGWSAYVSFSLVSDDGTVNRDGRFYFEVRQGKQLPQKRADNEWKVFVEPKRIRENWQAFMVNLPQNVERTFGQEGWTLGQVLGVRLRGPMTIARIRFYKRSLLPRH